MGIDTEYDDDELAERVRAALSQVAGDRSNQSVIIDNGKYMAVVAVLAVICGGCAVATWNSTGRQADIGKRYSEDSMYTQDQYQKERNHVIELEARLKILGDEVQEMKHVRR